MQKEPKPIETQITSIIKIESGHKYILTLKDTQKDALSAEMAIQEDEILGNTIKMISEYFKEAGAECLVVLV